MDLKESEILGNDIGSHWYYTSKAKAVDRLLGRSQFKKILDVGAGSGFFSRLLLKKNKADEAWCVDISYAADSDSLESDKKIHFRRSIEKNDADLVLLMDVLEHVEDDVGLLEEYIKKVPSKTTFLISVPAFKFLWSAHDEFLDHKRRYSLQQLESVVVRSGLVIEESMYYFGAVFPIAASLRLVQSSLSRGGDPESQLIRHSWLVNAFLKALCSIEVPFMRVNHLAGLTIFCLAKKN